MERLYYLDNLKGILILLVVIGHCIQFSLADYDHNLVFRYIYSFHMPLFMCVSGFLNYRHSLEWNTVRKRFFQLIIPFLSWTFLGSCIAGDMSLFVHSILKPDSSLWFLWALFFLIFLVKIGDSVALKIRIRQSWMLIAISLLLIALMVLFKIKIFGFQFIAWYLPFYMMGFYGHKYQEKWFSLRKEVFIISGIFFMFLAFFWMRKEPPTFMDSTNSIIFNYAYKFLVAFVALFSIIPLSRNFLSRKKLIITKLGGGNFRNICYSPNCSTYFSC